MTKIEDFKIIYGRDKEFREDFETIPFIKFPAKWYVKPVGPFGGATARFLVTLNPDSKKIVSIYADFHERLGFYGEPHWEVYPDETGDNSRCAISDTKTLIKLIKSGLKHLDRNGND